MSPQSPLESIPHGLDSLAAYFSGLSLEPSQETTPFEDVPPLESVFTTPELTSHDPIEHFLPPAMREDREIFSATFGMSSLFSDDPTRIPIALSDAAFAKQIFMHQKASDNSFFEATLKKRIVLASREKNLLQIPRSERHAQALYRAFIPLLGLSPGDQVPFDQDLFDQCVIESELNKLSKGPTVLLNNADRSDPDSLDKAEFVKLFAKSQIKAKAETINIAGKAGQTLALFQDRLLLLLGPWARYLARQIRARLPPSIFWHNKTTLSDLDDFVKANWKTRPSTTADATFYDYHQGAPGLLFEQMLFETFSMPQPLLSEYMRTKVDTQCFLGHMAIMRLTGEWFTLDGNTYYNIADFLLRHPQCLSSLMAPLHSPISRCLLVVGDDRCYNDVVVDPADDFLFAASSPPQKYETSISPSFVSLIVTSFGVFKDPITLHLRLRYHQISGTLDKVIPSYYLEHSIGLRTIRDNIELLSDLQVLCFDRNCLMFQRYRSRIPSFILGTTQAILTPLAILMDPRRRPLLLRLLRSFSANAPDLPSIMLQLQPTWSLEEVSQVFRLLNLYTVYRTDVSVRLPNFAPSVHRQL